MHPVEVRYVPTAADNDIQEVRFVEVHVDQEDARSNIPSVSRV